MVAVHWLDTKEVSFMSTSANPMECFGLHVSQNCGKYVKVLPTSLVQVE